MSTAVLPRLLHLLEVLAARGTVPGRQLAAELDVDDRTLRRDVDRLRQLGYPVESVRGRNGGYRLVRGDRLPPLTLDEREATAVVLGLHAMRAAGVGVGDVDALADRLVSLLHDAVADRVRAFRAALSLPEAASAGDTIAVSKLLDLGAAVRDRRGVLLRYVDRRGAETTRRLEPWGLVPHRRRWYLVGHDDLRDDVRLFRVDRISGVLPDGPARSPRPDDLDLRALVEQQITHDAWVHRVEVELHTDAEEARRRVPPALGEVTDEDGRVLLRVGADDLDGMARVLASLGLDLTVIAPDALRDSLSRLAARLADSASRPPS